MVRVHDVAAQRDAVAVADAIRRASVRAVRTLVSLFHSLTRARVGSSRRCDILIVYYVIYRTLLLIKGTRAAQMLIGIVLVGAGFFAAKLLELTTLSWLLDNLINYSIIFFIVIFQHDIRRGLMRVGQNLFIYARPYEQTYGVRGGHQGRPSGWRRRASARSSCSSATPTWSTT